MGPNTATIGGSAPKIMQDVVPPYAKVMANSIMAADTPTPAQPTPMPEPTPPAHSPAPTPEPPAPPAPAPEIPQTAPPAPTPPTPEPPAMVADVPVATEQQASEPMFPQVQGVEDHQAPAAPLAFTPKPQADSQAVVHHAKVSTNWLVIGLAVVVAVALATVAVSAMRG